MLDLAWFQTSQFCNKAYVVESHGGEDTHLMEARKQEEAGQGSKDKVHPAEPHH